MKERRRYPRMDLDAKIAYRLSDSPEGKKAVSQNISAEGFCFSSDEKLSIGTVLEIELQNRHNERPIRIRAKVVWSEKVKGENSYSTGVKVLDVNKIDEGRFLTLYCSRLIDRLDDFRKKEPHKS